ncbi:unnamed protein product [Umbelopsis ramanniana]
MRTGEEDTLKLQARIDDCHKRIEKYQAIPSKKKKGKKAVTKRNDDGDDDDNDDDVEDADDDVEQELFNSDISIRRLRRFKGMLKSLLLKGAIIGTSKHELTEKSGEMTDSEFTILRSIYNCVQHYMPPHSEELCIAYQIPLLLLSNQLLKAFKKTKKIMEIMPRVKSSVLHSLHLSSSSMYNLLGSSDQPCAFRNANGSVTTNQRTATWNKGAVFGSIFDLETIHNICSKRKLEFSFAADISPHLNTISIHGQKTNLIHHERTCLPRFPSFGNRIQKLPITDAERTVATQTLEVVLSDIERQNEKLKANVKTFKLAAFDKAIQEHKRRYTHGDTSVYLEIKRLKEERDIGFKSQEIIWSDLKAARQKAYSLRRDTERPLKSTKRKRSNLQNDSLNEQKKLVVSKTLSYGIERASRISLLGLKDSLNKLYVSGTDYGFVTMSVTAVFQKDRFEFHKALFRGERPENFTEFLQMPPHTMLTGSELNHRTLLYKSRWQLTKAKLTTICSIFSSQ